MIRPTQVPRILPFGKQGHSKPNQTLKKLGVQQSTNLEPPAATATAKPGVHRHQELQAADGASGFSGRDLIDQWIVNPNQWQSQTQQPFQHVLSSLEHKVVAMDTHSVFDLAPEQTITSNEATDFQDQQRFDPERDLVLFEGEAGLGDNLPPADNQAQVTLFRHLRRQPNTQESILATMATNPFGSRSSETAESKVPIDTPRTEVNLLAENILERLLVNSESSPDEPTTIRLKLQGQAFQDIAIELRKDAQGLSLRLIGSGESLPPHLEAMQHALVQHLQIALPSARTARVDQGDDILTDIDETEGHGANVTRMPSKHRLHGDDGKPPFSA